MKSVSCSLVFLLSIFCSRFALAEGTTWYVDATAPCPGNGTETSPFCSLQYAIEQPTTLNGDTILVLPGVYAEHIVILGRSVSIQSTEGAMATLIKNTSPHGTNPASSILIRGAGETSVRVEGLTIECGSGTNTNPSGSSWVGGGINCSGAALTVIDCRFIGGHDGPPTKVGGAICLTDSSIDMQDCLVTRAVATNGGGIAFLHSSGQVVRCEFIGNKSSPFFGPAKGGGIYCDDESTNVLIRECTFFNNRIEGRGGALCGPATVELCRIEENQAHDLGGGGIFGAKLVSKCLIRGNFGYHMGGGVASCLVIDSTLQNNFSDFSYFGSGGGAARSTLVNCVVVGNRSFLGAGAWDSTVISCAIDRNTAYDSGGGLHSSIARYSTITENYAHDCGGVMACSEVDHCTVVRNSSLHTRLGAVSDSFLTNSIVWDNVEPSLTFSAAAYCDIQGGLAGLGNINADPLFWNASGSDLRLRYGSPCIDTGDPLFQLDPDGSFTDMGAHWADPAFCGEPFVYCTAKLNSVGCLPSIVAEGACVEGQDGFHIKAGQVVNQTFGFLVWGFAPASLPFKNGTLCVQLSNRTDAQSSLGNPPPADCSGSFDFHFSAAYMAEQQLPSGAALFAQYWYRDPEHPDGTGVGLTDALQFMICPAGAPD